MSWDILIMNLPRDVKTMSELPVDFQPEPLGNRGELISAVLSAAPMADFSDPSWGEIVTRDFSIEVNIGKKEQVDSIMLHVRGSDAAIELIAEILDRLDGRALDIQTGEMFNKASAATSFAAWRAYRDQVVNPPSQVFTFTSMNGRCRRVAGTPRSANSAFPSGPVACQPAMPNEPYAR